MGVKIEPKDKKKKTGTKKSKEEIEIQKKLSPDNVDDEETKNQEYEDPALMKLIAGEEGDELEVELSEEEKEKTKQVEKEKEKKEAKEEDMDEEVPFDDEEKSAVVTEKEEKVETEEDEEAEPERKEQKIELSEQVQNALKPYEGNLQQKFDGLVKAYNSALAEISSLNNVKNVVKEVFGEEMKPHETIAAFKELRTVAFDFMQNPDALDVVHAVMSGKIPEELQRSKKTPKNFMPKGQEEDYSYAESMEEPESASWKAREAWENDRKAEERKADEFIRKITEKKENISNIYVQLKQASEKLTENLNIGKAFAKEEYGMSDDVFEEQVEKQIKNIGPELIKLIVAVTAKKNNIKSKQLKKIESQKDKSFAETELSESVEERESTLEPSNKEQDKELEETFPDWNQSDNIYV